MPNFFLTLAPQVSLSAAAAAAAAAAGTIITALTLCYIRFAHAKERTEHKGDDF